MINRSTIFRIGLLVLVVVIMAISLAISFAVHDPHWLNRGGAFIAACSAVAGYFQIRSEIGIEIERHKLEDGPHEVDNDLQIGPLGQLAGSLKHQKIKHQTSWLTEERLKIAASVVLCASFGELLHGFGDLLFRLFFASYFLH